MPLRSPYEVALGERLRELHPTLRRYFSAIPSACVGVGDGVFTEIGTERRWLWPLLKPFERRGVLFAGHARAVRFRVVNRTDPGHEAGVGADKRCGVGLANALRTLDLPDGEWTMTDSVAHTRSGVVDRLGAPWTVSAAFDVAVRDGGLTLTSRAVGLILGRMKVRVPSPFAPVVRLSERYDAVSGMQHVELGIDMPLIGRVYGYRGHFSYAIVREREGAAA